MTIPSMDTTYVGHVCLLLLDSPYSHHDDLNIFMENKEQYIHGVCIGLGTWLGLL